MDVSLAGRTALVTGTTGEIRHGIARELARPGAFVAVNSRTPERVVDAIGRLAREVPIGPRRRRFVRAGLADPGRDDPLRKTRTALPAVPRGVAEKVAATCATVNAVVPGPTLSEGAGTSCARWRRPDPRRISRRSAAPSSASMVAYICSPATSATTGAVLRVDGGVVQAIV
jgi:NAD(P)-dependent dehydrogenase (short-subunit alcohol dehydrogenase family)